MPIVNKSNISLGLGNLEFGTYTTEQANTPDVFGAYQDVGAIKAELSITITREVLAFESGRPLITILQEVIREKVVVKATLAEVAVATIKMALGQGVTTSGVIPTFLDNTSTALSGTLQTGLTALVSGNLLQFGGIPTHAYIGLRFTHVKANGNRHVFEGYKASPTGTLMLPFKETDWNQYEVEFNLLADTTKTAGQQYFQLFMEGANP
jgi:hypothetical protein